jgi:5-methylcytosine-specific restriction endonuclease McrA
MKTLVLNAGYEPLSIVPFTRAVVLVLTGKATVLAAEDVPVRSEHVSLDQPSVILLTRYVRPPNSRRVSLSRRGVLRRDNHRCAYCGKAASTGGVPLCFSSRGKGQIPQEYSVGLGCQG